MTTALRPYYQDDLVTLWHGRSDDVLPAIEAATHIITDPPYSEHVHGNYRSQRWQSNADTIRTVDLGFAHLEPDLREFCAAEFARIAQRWVITFSDIESAPGWRDDLCAAGLDYVRTGAWVRIGCTPQFSGDRPAVGFEALTITHPRGRKRWNGGGSHAVWSYPIVRGSRVHTTQKPEALMLDLVAKFTDPGDLILDPFAGAGTTLVAAKRMGRRAIGIEMSEQYCEATVSRLAQESITFPAEEAPAYTANGLWGDA